MLGNEREGEWGVRQAETGEGKGGRGEGSSVPCGILIMFYFPLGLESEGSINGSRMRGGGGVSIPQCICLFPFEINIFDRMEVDSWLVVLRAGQGSL